MRGSFALSVCGHLAILAWASFAFPSAKPFEVDPVKALPVDIVDISELTKLKAGSKKDAKAVQPKAEKPEPVKPEAKPAPEPKAEPVKKVAALPPPPAPEPEEQKVATPAPPLPREEPKVEEKKAEPEAAPAPKKPEPKPEEAKVEEKKPEPAQNAPVPPSRPRHVPKSQKPAKRDPKFDPNNIAALLNKMPDKAATTPADQPKSDAPAQGDARGSDDRMSLSELDALRAQMSRCWSPPIGVQGAEDLTVRLKVELNTDGSLRRPPELLTAGSSIAFLAAADSARRAVLRCQPYQLPPEKYGAWRDINVTFDPREMLGG